jgi:methyl-accepting chemotaxis protein
MTWSSLDINEQNTTDAIAWIECACRMLDQLAKERARNAMAVMDQLEHARRVAQDADDVIDTMERTIAEAKAVVTKQSDLIQQLRQASA